jgi:hypothetical protein
MKNLERIERMKSKHLVISETNYYKLKCLGKMGDTFDTVLGELLSKELNKNTTAGVQDEVQHH